MFAVDVCAVVSRGSSLSVVFVILSGHVDMQRPGIAAASGRRRYGTLPSTQQTLSCVCEFACVSLRVSVCVARRKSTEAMGESKVFAVLGPGDTVGAYECFHGPSHLDAFHWYISMRSRRAESVIAIICVYVCLLCMSVCCVCVCVSLCTGTQRGASKSAE